MENRTVTNYIWLDDIPVAQFVESYDSTGTHTGTRLAYVHADHLYTPAIATGYSESVTPARDDIVIWEMRWTTAYGFAFNSSDPDGDSIHNNLWLRFPGQIYYGIGSYNYNYFRDYDQLTGRYLESDPIGLSGGMNSYAYGASSPLVNVDRLGLVVCKCKATGGGAPIGNISKVCTYKCKCQCANDPSKWRSTTRLIPSTRYSQEETGFLCIGQRSIWVWRTEYNYGTGRTRKWRELEGVDFYPFVVDTDTSYVGDDDMEALRKTLETEDEVPCC